MLDGRGESTDGNRRDCGGSLRVGGLDGEVGRVHRCWGEELELAREDARTDEESGRGR